MGPPIHPAALPEEALLAEVDEVRSRGTGPGGQRRNKVQSQVRMVHRPTGLSGLAGERRSLERNRAEALFRLRLALALKHREPARARPSERWMRRTAGPALAVSPSHPDTPALLAEALDTLAATEDDVPAAAERLGVTNSRLVRVLKLEPAALTGLNERLRATDRATWR
jgi:hypothetical protein